MSRYRWTATRVLMLAVVFGFAFSAVAQDNASPVPDDKIAALDARLAESDQAQSETRRKLALRRVIREGEALLKQYSGAPNRYEVLGVLFRGQQALVAIDNSAANRESFLATCRQLAAAPDAYAAQRLDADLLLSQADLARRGADLKTRADALRPFVERYRDTEVEAKVIRIAMLMALEFGDTRVVNQLRAVIAERFPGDPELIIFQRDKLAGQVFGAPFIGVFERSDGGVVRFPMDYLGKTTAVFFWSKDNGGEEHLKELAAVWQAKKEDALGRLSFVSINLDNLPDAGASLLRENGLDWPALRLPEGRDSVIYQAYARRDPTLLTVSTTGYAALFMAGGNSHTRGYERWLNSSLARVWTHPRYTSQVQSLLAGEFLILDPTGAFDPASPPELKAVAQSTSDKNQRITRAADAVPEDKLRAIQACFIDPPNRYRTAIEEVRAGYEKADALCREAIKDHAGAPDLWIVRNRRIVALMGLWKMTSNTAYLEQAAAEAQAALDAGYPEGTDVVARLCIARHALHSPEADPQAVVTSFSNASETDLGQGPALAAAALLSLEIGERRLHEQYRRAILDHHVNQPMLWTFNAFLLDRYHRYWMYHPPFVAGWTYGRRQGHFLAIGTPEDAQRNLRLELQTLDGTTFRIPEESEGKWTVIQFVPDAQSSGHLARYGTFVNDRPFEDVNLIAAVLDDDADAAREALAQKKKPDDFPTLLVPGGMQNTIVLRLGILAEDTRPNLLIVRPDGRIASFLSGLTMSAQHGNVIQNVIEWHDEKAVDDALARGDLELAKRLAFAYAPPEESASPDGKKPRRNPITVPHLRSRAKVYMAMGDLESAYADAEAAYLAVNSRAGWLSMRTDELEMTEKLKDHILSQRDQQPAESSEE